MSTNNQIALKIFNQERRKKIEETFAKEIQPFLEENRKAYKLYKQGKISLDLMARQKNGF